MTCALSLIIYALFLQALRQAQELVALVYRIVKTIPLGRRLYTVDIFCNRKSLLGISAVNVDNFNKIETVTFNSPSGLYIAFEEKYDMPDNFIFGAENSVFIKSSNNGISDLWPGMHTKYHPLIPGLTPRLGFTPQGIAVRKSGGILICLWNNEIGPHSYGKVILGGDNNFQIFTDKNNPLYICPSYIAENGNGDICVSDVRAVVVTDAGGMLKFRYQGYSSSSDFDPYGICCDSKYNIIVADMKNNKIHIIDKDGKFLHYVTYQGMRMPRALSIDEDDNVYVGEWDSDTIQVISR